MNSPEARLQTGADVVTFLKSQHKEVKELFGKVLNASGEAKLRAFRTLENVLAAHEAGEEAVVHPAAATAIPHGDVIVKERLHEEQKAKRAIAALGHLDVDSTEFDDKLRTLQADVLAHAEREEREEFDKLSTSIDEPRLQRMREAVDARGSGRLDPTALRRE